MFKSTLKTTVAAAAIALAGISGAALADTTVHDQMQPVATSVAQILQDTKDDQRVSLRGQITKQTSEEKFIFTDGSGEIQLDIDDDLTKVQPINPPVEVEIIGEVDKGLISDTEIEVKSYTIVQ
ncbi:MAG: NirD/YgiW/YdeI family stress tolerance protein [Alcaligenaceae bacterium]|nr:NirD/YgiW/YdeI family stress tolerance protein [Alcaligenaceae bacterium]